MSESLGKRMRGLRGDARLTAIRDVVSQWRATGQSQAAFCREVGIATVTLGRWLRRLEVERKSGEPVLVEVDLPDPRGNGDGYEVVLESGIWVGIPAGFRDDDLARLLRALTTAC